MGDAALQQPVAWNKRFKRNCYIYIIIYGFMGAVTGVTNNTYVSYLDLVSPKMVQGMNIYSAISAIIMSLLLLYIHKVGYKKVLVISPIVSIIGLGISLFTYNDAAVATAFVLMSAGVGMFDFVYPLMFTSYVPKEKRVTMMSRVMYVNLITQAIVTFFGGKIVVWIFSKLHGVTYTVASKLSADASKLSGQVLTDYIDSYKSVIYIAIAFTLCALVFAFFLKEKPADYRETESERAERKQKFNFKGLFTKTVVLWIVFLALIRCGALLVVPYFPIYLNNFLHIDRGVVSTIITLQTVAMLIGYFFAPWLEKKLGSINSIGILTLLCVPLMLVMANGALISPANVAWIIGSILFVRSGLANASMPIQQTIQMTFVSKDFRPAFSSVITLMQAGVGILVGLFTQFFLLKRPSGYATAYYWTSGFYTVACIMMMICFHKYNRSLDHQKKGANKDDEASDKADKKVAADTTASDVETTAPSEATDTQTTASQSAETDETKKS